MTLVSRLVLAVFAGLTAANGHDSNRTDCSRASKCKECEARDCDYDYQCQPGLLCAEVQKHKEKLLALGLHPRKAYCGREAGKDSWHSCFDPTRFTCTRFKTCDECRKKDCNIDDDCTGRLLCAAAHRSDLIDQGFNPRLAYCDAIPGRKYDRCYDPSKLVCQPSNPCESCEPRDCEDDYDCDDGLFCAQSHTSELIGQGFDPRKADCGEDVGLATSDLCFNSSILECDPGYEVVDYICQDIDECSDYNLNMCHPNAQCNNTDGGYTCSCRVGFIGNGWSCDDIDECIDASLNTCHDKATCTNTHGGHYCTCNAGYEGDGSNCTNINECAREIDTCDFNASCTDTDGGFQCTCKPGYVGNGTICTDVDECADLSLNTCHDNATCTNTMGGYTCRCNAGYEGDGSNCTNINECAREMDNCDVNASCTDTDGGFQCTCKPGYVGNGTTCSDVDECAAPLLNTCHSNATCTNTNGNYTCACNTGYVGDGVNCTESCSLRECCADADCGDTSKFTCDLALFQCVLRNCTVSPETQCCIDSDCGNSTQFRCVSNFCVRLGNPSFSLSWFGEDDLDLHVLTPLGTHIFFGAKYDPASKGRLDVDHIPRATGRWTENVFFPEDGTAPAGNYTYWVRNYNQQGSDPDNWSLRAFVGGTTVATHVGVTTDNADGPKFTYANNI